MNRIAFVAVLMALLLNACAQATPTIDPVQVQATAVAAAGTMLALTQAAVPTATEVPPSPLPSPSPQPSLTPLVLPTLDAGAPPAVATSGGTTANTSGDPCKGLMSSNPAGPLTTFKISNATKAPITVSVA